MNRLHKKCFIASAGFHLLLIAVLFVGPAFLTSKAPRLEGSPVLTFIDPGTIVSDKPFSNPGAGVPKPPTPPPPTPQVIQAQQPVQRQPEPQREVEQAKTEDSFDPTQHKPKVNLKPVVRNSQPQKKPKQTNPVDAQATQAKELADSRRRLAAQIASTAQSLHTSAATEVEGRIGEGGGQGNINYAQLVKSIYEGAWLPPDDSSNDDANTKVSVTIASDGHVVDAHIIGRSGEPRVDGSVERTLERVTNIAPFPDGAREKQRTYTINFNLKAKRGLG